MHFPITKVNFSIYPYPMIIKNMHFPLIKVWGLKLAFLLLSVWLEKNWVFHNVIMLLFAQKLVFAYSYTLWAPCQWPCRLRWRLVAFASWCVFGFGIISGSCGDHFGIRLGSFWDHLASFWDYFGPTSYRFPIFPDFSFLYLSSFRDHLEITLGTVMGHFVIIVCTWHSPGIILEFLWGHLV